MTKLDEHGDRHTSLRQQADLVCSALDAVPHGFAVLTVEGRVLAANGTLKRWAGDDLGQRGEAATVTVGGPALQGFCLSQRSELRGAVARAAHGEAVCFETDHLELVPDARGAFSVLACPWTLEGRHVAVCLLIHDVTDEPGARDRASEMSFRQLFDSVPDGLLVVRGSLVLYANRSSCALLGYDWQDELAGRPVFDLVRRADGEPGLPEDLSEDVVPVQLVARDGGTRSATMARARLMIDEAPTTVLALRLMPRETAELELGLVEVLHEALVDVAAKLSRMRDVGAGALGFSERFADVELAVRRSLGTVRELRSRWNGTEPDGGPTEVEAVGDSWGARSNPDTKVPTVLVCDDESRLAMLTAGLLDQYGYGAVTVATGAEALEQLHIGHCDVILLDMNLPDGSADQVIAQMNERGLGVPVILTSGYAEEDVDPKLLSDRLVASYLPKPYSVDRLVQAIQGAIGGVRLPSL